MLKNIFADIFGVKKTEEEDEKIAACGGKKKPHKKDDDLDSYLESRNRSMFQREPVKTDELEDKHATWSASRETPMPPVSVAQEKPLPKESAMLRAGVTDSNPEVHVGTVQGRFEEIDLKAPLPDSLKPTNKKPKNYDLELEQP